jgi:hypothetical protein
MILTSCGQDTGDFNPDEIKDTDQDGLPEFVDKFGTPIQFYLWPSYHGANSMAVPLSSSSPMQNPGAESDPDDPSGLLLQADWWGPAMNSDPRPNFERLFHTVTHFLPTPPPTNGWQPKGFKTYPLVVSAGPDAGFGFQCVYQPSIPGLDFRGFDKVMGTLDDTSPPPLPPAKPSNEPAIGLTLSAGADGILGTSDDSSNPIIFISPALRIMDPAIDGYGMDGDNIDNHRLRAR